jgi:hypothetical protein
VRNTSKGGKGLNNGKFLFSTSKQPCKRELRTYTRTRKVNYENKKTGANSKEIKKAIKQVGNSREKVENN